jgi:hypothetical protein
MGKVTLNLMKTAFEAAREVVEEWKAKNPSEFLWRVGCGTDDSILISIDLVLEKIRQLKIPNNTAARASKFACPDANLKPSHAQQKLRKDWNRFYGWLEKRGYARRSYANSRRFSKRVGDDIRHRLGRLTGWRRKRSFKLAMMLLGLNARTVKGNGSRWDCTTRMFQLVAQARRLAGIGKISYSGWRRRKLETISNKDVYDGYHLRREVILLMAVGHYKERRTARMLMRWKTPLLSAGGVWKPEHESNLAVGDIFFYPDYGPGHFGTLLWRSAQFMVVVEGYWRGLPTVIHLYKKRADYSDRCMARKLSGLRGFDALLTDGGRRHARNVIVGSLTDKGRIRVGEHK